MSNSWAINKKSAYNKIVNGFLAGRACVQKRQEMKFSHAELGWVHRVSGITLGHVIQFLFLVIRSNSFPTHLAPFHQSACYYFDIDIKLYSL